ncbi:hypothetical protein AC93_2822 [Escherichia coli 2-005-03_S4_C2]|nr:hypothetical protein AD23_2953 [Escherichia coli 2-005-03_S4_C3]EZJ49578.1 hypothetical protein AC93_2822 [Escherichia coli 2-005-03_S4_C2]KDT26599.1 hypothetical protein AC67_2974 [Escherichia coli 2-052-05_S4_C1]
MSGSAFAVTHHAFSSGAGRTSDGNGSHASTLKSPSYTKSVSWQHYHKLAAIAAPAEIFLLEDGIDGWKKAGLPVAVNKSQPLPLMRQVQIAAGGLILIGVVLGYTVNSVFFLLSGFVGAGLLFAGISGFCGMARLLDKMPWNQRA